MQVFGVRDRNAWLRRRVALVLRQLVHAAFGASISRKIVECAHWLTSDEQLAEYLRALRCAPPLH